MQVANWKICWRLIHYVDDHEIDTSDHERKDLIQIALPT